MRAMARSQRPRLRRLRRARKPTASKNPPADHQGRGHLAGVADVRSERVFARPWSSEVLLWAVDLMMMDDDYEQLGATWRCLRVARSHLWVSPLSAAAGIFSTLFSLFNLVVFLGLVFRHCSTPKSTEQTLIPRSKKKWRHFDVRHRQRNVLEVKFWILKG